MTRDITASVDTLSCTPMPQGSLTESAIAMGFPPINAAKSAERAALLVNTVLAEAFPDSALGVSLQPGLLTPANMLLDELNARGIRATSFDLPYIMLDLIQKDPGGTLRHILSSAQEVAFAGHQYMTFGGLRRGLRAYNDRLQSHNSQMPLFRTCSQALANGSFERYLIELKRAGFKNFLVGIEINAGTHSITEYINTISRAQQLHPDVNIGYAIDYAHMYEAALKGSCESHPTTVLTKFNEVLLANPCEARRVHAVEVNLIQITQDGGMISHAPFTKDTDQGPIGHLYPRLVRGLSAQPSSSPLHVIIESNPTQFNALVNDSDLARATINYLRGFST